MSKNRSGGGRSTRTVYFDVLNIVACFGVVCMHFNGLTHAYSHTPAWREALFVDCLFNWAVPIFFMLTGANLMKYREKYSTEDFFKRRSGKTLVPFLAWSLIALVWKVATGQMEPPVGPRSLIDLVLNTKIIDIYWFFIPLFAIYLSMPILSLLSDNRRMLAYGAAMAFALNVLCPNLASLSGVTWNSSLSFPVLAGYLVYVVLGHLLREWDPSRKQRAVIYALGVAGTALRYLGTVIASDKAGELVRFLWGYTNFPCFLEAVAVFVLAKSINWNALFKTEASKRVLAKVSGCSFGIYLTHMIVFWYGLLLTGLQGADLAWRTLGPVIAYLVCLIITYVGKRIPGIKLLFP